MNVRGISCLLAFVVLVSLHGVTWSSVDDGKVLFEKRCGACHQLPNPAESPAQGWEFQLEQMAKNARLKPGQKQNVLEYLISHTQASVQNAALDEDRELFEQKCSRCHTLRRVFLEPLTVESRRHVIARMQTRSGTDWLSDDDVERILAYLDVAIQEAAPAEALPVNVSAQETFGVRCSACHTLERVYSFMRNNPDETWAHVVSRMRGKAPQWMTDAEAARIRDYLAATAPAGG